MTHAWIIIESIMISNRIIDHLWVIDDHKYFRSMLIHFDRNRPFKTLHLINIDHLWSSEIINDRESGYMSRAQFLSISFDRWLYRNSYDHCIDHCIDRCSYRHKIEEPFINTRFFFDFVSINIFFVVQNQLWSSLNRVLMIANFLMTFLRIFYNLNTRSMLSIFIKSTLMQHWFLIFKYQHWSILIT